MKTMDSIFNELKTKIAGEVLTNPEKVIKNDNEYVSFIVGTKRDSGVIDKVPVFVPVGIRRNLNIGDKVYVIGVVRTCQKHPFDKLELFVVVQYFKEYYKDKDIVYFMGMYCKEPKLRRTPLGRTVCDVILANNYDGYSSYIPCLIWGESAIEFSENFSRGKKVFVRGRFQSREYEKVLEDRTEIRTAYEISINKVFDFSEENKNAKN